jgi:hypothetical protein
VRHVSEKRKEWLEHYRRVLHATVPTGCARCDKGGQGWKHMGGDFEPHHVFLRRTRWACAAFLPLCHHCHEWVHANGRQAREDGWIVEPKKPNP